MKIEVEMRLKFLENETETVSIQNNDFEWKTMLHFLDKNTYNLINV